MLFFFILIWGTIFRLRGCCLVRCRSCAHDSLPHIEAVVVGCCMGVSLWVLVLSQYAQILSPCEPASVGVGVGCCNAHTNRQPPARCICVPFSDIRVGVVYVDSRGNVGRTSVTATGGSPHVVTAQRWGGRVQGVQVCGANNSFLKKTKN